MTDLKTAIIKGACKASQRMKRAAESDRLLLDSLSPHTAIVCGVCLEDEQACECASQAGMGERHE